MTSELRNYAWAMPNKKGEAERVCDLTGLSLFLGTVKYVFGVDLSVEEGKVINKGPKLLRKWQIVIVSSFICTFALGTVVMATREIFFTHKLSATQKISSWIPTIMPQVVAITFVLHVVAFAPKYRHHIQKLSELVIHSHGQWYTDRHNRAKIRRLFILTMLCEGTLIVIDVLLVYYANHRKLNDHIDSGSMTAKPLITGVSFLGIIVLKLASTIYRVGFILCCKVLSFAFDAMQELKPKSKRSFSLYQSHHRNACRLVKENDALFSGILFLTLVNDFFYIVINAKVLLGLRNSVPIFCTLFALFNKIAASVIKGLYASRVNIQVVSTLQYAIFDGRSTSTADLSTFDKERGNYLLYVATLSADYPAITYGGLFVAKNEIFFTFGGTLISYIILVKDLNENTFI